MKYNYLLNDILSVQKHFSYHCALFKPNSAGKVECLYGFSVSETRRTVEVNSMQVVRKLSSFAWSRSKWNFVHVGSC